MKPRFRHTSGKLPAILLMLVLCVAPAVFAGDGDGDGGQIGEFLRYGAGVRSLGMGRANVAAADDAAGIYYNSAGLTRLSTKYSYYFMRFAPLSESEYLFFSAALARPDSKAVGLKGFFFGPEAAWGIAAVHMNTGGFEYRDADDRLLDSDFSMYQQAAMISFARELSGPAGILGYGFNFKIIRQGVGNTDTQLKNSDVGFGVDFGTQLQMINPPLLKKLTSVPLVGPFFKLKRLLPLRLGLNIQNLIPPKVGFGGEAEKYPTTVRLGGSYFLDNPGWLDGLNLLETSRIMLVSDLEKVFAEERGFRWYTGVEVEWQNSNFSLMLPRFGYSTSVGPGRFSCGLGLKGLIQNMTVQFDFAYGFHAELGRDLRVSMTLTRGAKRDAHYWARDGQTYTSLSRRDAMIHVLSGYPDNLRNVEMAAAELADSLDSRDSINVQRYYDLIGGPVNARYRAGLAIAAFQDDKSSAETDALKAISLFGQFYAASPHLMLDSDHLLHGQCEMINAATSNDATAWTRGAEILARSNQVSLKKHFLIGTCYHMLESHQDAANQFEAALKTADDDSQSMRTFARLWLGEALLNSNHADSAIGTLRSLTEDRSLPMAKLDEDYSRYWTFKDEPIADDAQYLIARCYLSQGNVMQAAAEFIKVCRFYPGSDKCSAAKEEAKRLIEK